MPLRLSESSVLKFQSTPSVGRATGSRGGGQFPSNGISIHALRGEGDGRMFKAGMQKVISIHALRGEGDAIKVVRKFGIKISIHALRGEGDFKLPDKEKELPTGFQSTPSVGRATTKNTNQRANNAKGKFQSTPSVGRATLKGRRSVPLQWNFNPRPPWGGRRYC